MEDKKSRLVHLGSEALAEMLLKLAANHEAVNNAIESVLASPKDNVKRFKSRLSGIKRMKRLITWQEAPSFKQDLLDLLENLSDGVRDPKSGVECVLSFYEADEAIFEHCDDSNGAFGDLYRYEAKELFISYASKCEDKEWLIQKVLKVTGKDNYGIRDTLIECTARYLSEPAIRSMIDTIQRSLEGTQGNDFRKRHLSHIESLARQIKDAPLFEKTCLAYWGKHTHENALIIPEELPVAVLLDIAQVYLESGAASTALTWLDRVSKEEHYKANERDALYLKVYTELGDQPKREEIAWRLFRRHRSAQTFSDLLAVIGQEHEKEILVQEIQTILSGDQSLSYTHASFMIDMGYIDEAESYLISRADQLKGAFYGTLLPLAEALEKKGRWLAATLLFRALLDSILERGNTKTYTHGVRYLKKLDRMADTITGWHDKEPHVVYVEKLKQDHGRKSSFWALYKK